MPENNDEALKLKAEIEEAFADVPYPGDDNIGKAGYFEGVEVAEHFKGIKWQDYKDNPSQFLTMRLNGDLSFMTHEAFRYYLPLYMIQALIDRKNADCLPDGIITSFETTGIEIYDELVNRLGLLRMKNPPSEAQKRDYVARRLAPMTVRQLEVILAYLKFIEKREGKAYGDCYHVNKVINTVANELRNRQDK